MQVKIRDLGSSSTRNCGTATDFQDGVVVSAFNILPHRFKDFTWRARV
jgi:hypothetical protein